MANADVHNIERITRFIRCPCCQANLALLSSEKLRCRQCRSEFPVWRGILDLRTVETLKLYYSYAPNWLKDNREFEAAIEEKFEQLSYPDLIKHALDCWGLYLTKEIKEAYIRVRLDDRERGKQRASLLKQKASALFDGGNRELVGIDIGCGSGSTLYALSKICHTVIGLDYFRCDLIIARKLIETEGLSNVHLIAGVLESSILQPCSCNVVTARDVLEHVRAPLHFLEQCLHLLKARGLLNFNSANRYAIIPEPHVTLWGVGFLPRFAQRPYVRLFRNQPYENMRLLSLREVIGFTKNYPHCRSTFKEPHVSNMYARRMINKIPFEKIRAFLATFFSDQHEVYLFKEQEDSRDRCKDTAS